MKLNIYAIFDSATNAYMQPFPMQSDGQALRAFTDLAVRADHDIGQHPEDYSLWRVGSFDDNEGLMEGCTLKCLGRAHEIAAASRDDSKVVEMK